MAKWLRLAALCAGLLVFGVALTAAAFTWFDAAHSDAVVTGLALSLCVGNFVLLRRGVEWAARRPRALSVDVGHSDRTPAAVTVAR